MKKFVSAIVAITLVLLLASCGSSGDSTLSSQESTPPVDEMATPEPTLQHTLEEVMTDVLLSAENAGLEVSDEAKAKIREMYDAGNDDAFDIFNFLLVDGWLYASPSMENLRDQIFYKISPFSEERAWVQYRDDTQELITAVINTVGEIIFTPAQKVIGFLPYSDGYAVYLYAVDPMQNDSSDNVRSCIVDTAGNITYDSSVDGGRFIFAYGGGNFLALEHISNFEKDEWSFGVIDKDGKSLAAFEKCDSFNGYPANLMSECKYLNEDIFFLKNAIYNLKSRSSIYYGTMDFVKGVFHDGCALVFKKALLEGGFFNLTSAGEDTLLFKGSMLDASDTSEYADGLYFYDKGYYDLDGNLKISFPQYDGKYFRGGTFYDSIAPLHIKGADGLDYFTIINLEGNTVIDPVPGLPADKFSEGYLVVQTESGCALYDTSGKKVLDSSYNVLGAIGGSSTEVKNGYFVAYSKGTDQPVFVGVDGSQIGQ